MLIHYVTLIYTVYNQEQRQISESEENSVLLKFTLNAKNNYVNLQY